MAEEIKPSLRIEDVLNSKCYIKGVTFKSPKEYFDPFIKLLDYYKFVDRQVKVQDTIQNANENEELNTSFGRILIQGTKSFNTDLNFDCGLIVSLDTQKPVIKSYFGLNVSAYTNLCIFNAKHISTYSIFGENYEKVYSDLSENISNQDLIALDYQSKIDILKSEYLSIKKLEKLLGKIVFASVKDQKLGTNIIIAATKKLRDSNSPYYVNKGTTKWNVYNAFTQHITNDSDIVEKANKTFNLTKYFLN